MPDLSNDARHELARSCATDVLGSEPTTMINPLTVLASPAWRGVEGDIWRAEVDGRPTILKHYHADTEFYVDRPSAILAAGEAAKLGVGPAVMKGWLGQGVIAFEALDSPWVAGGLHHATDSDIRANVIAQKKAFQTGAHIGKDVSIFREVDRLFGITVVENIPTHNDISTFMDYASEAEGQIASLGWDAKPCHRDGNTANLMVHSDKSVRLIDFDLAGVCDPFEDVGAYLIEFFENDLDARRGFEEWHGSFDEGLFQRSMIYGLMDDLRWGLIGSIMGARSPRKGLEFTKYAAWRFMRLQAHAKRSDANDRIRAAA